MTELSQFKFGLLDGIEDTALNRGVYRGPGRDASRETANEYEAGYVCGCALASLPEVRVRVFEIQAEQQASLV